MIDDPAQLMSWSPVSFWAIRDANGEQLRTVDSFLNMGKAKNVRDLLRRQDAGGGIPWVNTTAADRQGNVLYADHSVVPHVTNALASRCMTVVGRLINQVAGLPGLNGNLADTSCKWGSDSDAQRPGIFGPKNLPDVIRRDWVMNANDSYWLPNPDVRLEGYANIIGCEECVRTMRTKMVMQYVIDRLASGKETPASLRGHEHENRLRAAEVMRQGGALDAVCAATGETAACAVLKKWDGRSERTSVGTHIFEEFIERLPANPWSVPFSAADPLNTPRGLKTSGAVVDAMSQAIASLRQRKIPFDAKWGTLQVAGDRGAPPIGLGGGSGDDVGNANALASRNPVGEQEQVPADHLRLLAHPGDLVPRGREGRRPDDPDLRPERGPDVAVLRATRPSCSGPASGSASPGRPPRSPATSCGSSRCGASGARSWAAGPGDVGELGVVGVGESTAGVLLVDVGDQARGAGCQQHADPEHDEADGVAALGGEAGRTVLARSRSPAITAAPIDPPMVRMLAFIPLATPVCSGGTEAITTPARLAKTRPEPKPWVVVDR